MSDKICGIVMLTRNRLPLLKWSLPALLRSIVLPAEIVVVDNGSTDGSVEYLQKLIDNYRGEHLLRGVFHTENRGTAAYNDALFSLHTPYLIEVDDDVIQFPARWDQRLIDALVSTPELGYVSTDVVQDEWTNGNRADGSKYGSYSIQSAHHEAIEIGVVGGWCAATPRKLFVSLGGFPFSNRGKFELEDGGYANLLVQSGMRFGVIKQLKVYHACGPKYAIALGFWSEWIGKYDPATDPLYALVERDPSRYQLPETLPNCLRIPELLHEFSDSVMNEIEVIKRVLSDTRIDEENNTEYEFARSRRVEICERLASSSSISLQVDVSNIMQEFAHEDVIALLRKSLYIARKEISAITSTLEAVPLRIDENKLREIGLTVTSRIQRTLSHDTYHA